MEADDLIFGFDVGTTAVKGVVFTTQGQQVFAKRIDCANQLPRPGWVEQEPQRWMDCIDNIVAQASRNIDISTLKAIGICSQVNTHIFVDADGNALDRAIIWQDQRCSQVAEELQIRAGQLGLEIDIDSSSLLSRAEWFAREQTRNWEQCRWILSPKDYCILQLTGEAASDSLSSIGLVDLKGSYDETVIDLVDGLQQRLPPLKAITDIAGECRESYPVAGCPVAVGTMDAWASLYGSGCRGSGDAFQLAGTSEIIGVLSNESHDSPGVVSFPPMNGVVLHAGPTQAGGDALSWFSEATGKTIDELLSMAETQACADEPLLFLPYLMGERAPIWDAEARATFCGLSRRHTEADMVLALLQGVAFSARHLLEEIEKAAGFHCDGLRLSGGASRSDLWCQVKANAMHVKLERVQNIDTGTFGAALMAMVGIGAYRSMDEATTSAVKIDKVFRPETENQHCYQALYEIYRDCYTQLRPVFSKLSELQKQTS